MNITDKIVKEVEQWVNTIVVGLNLCPFAKREIDKGRVRYAVSSAVTEEGSLVALESELEFIIEQPEVETTLLILPNAFADFYDFNQFLDYVDALVEQMQLTGTIQIASFHPLYQFANTEADAIENYTNRSPYPILHLLREESLEKAINQYPKADQIPVSNIAMLRKMGKSRFMALIPSQTSEKNKNTP